MWGDPEVPGSGVKIFYNLLRSTVRIRNNYKVDQIYLPDARLELLKSARVVVQELAGDGRGEFAVFDARLDPFRSPAVPRRESIFRLMSEL